MATTVSANVPVGVVPPTFVVIVIVAAPPEVVMDAGAKPHVVLAGQPVTDRAATSGTPKTNVVVRATVLFPEAPRTRVSAVGVRARVNSLGLSVRPTVVVCVADGAAASIVSVEVPSGVEPVVVTVSVDVPPLVPMGFDPVNAQVALAGQPPVTLSVAASLKPEICELLIVYVTTPPGPVDRVVGVAASEKSLMNPGPAVLESPQYAVPEPADVLVTWTSITEPAAMG